MDRYTQDGKKEIIERTSPRSRTAENVVKAFFFGGAICGAAEVQRGVLLSVGVEEESAPLLVSLTVIAIASVLTLLGVFDRIARHAGAGTLVPISGFSNSVTSQAMDARSEGFILGVGAKIFSVSGPVILFVLTSGVIYGFIYYIYTLLS